MNAPIVLPAQGWPCDNTREDYRAGLPIWREVSVSFYEQMRGCVPPIELGQGLPGFMVGEPHDHTDQGAIHLALAHLQGRFFARLLPRKAVRAPITDLRLQLERTRPRMHVVHGRAFVVLAAFSGADYVAKANAFMAICPESSLLADKNGEAIIAATADKGVPVDFRELAKHGLAWALENYEQGGHWVYETRTEADLAEEMAQGNFSGDAITAPDEAVAMVKEIVELMLGQERECAFDGPDGSAG